MPDVDDAEFTGKPGDFTGKWDPELMRRVIAVLRRVVKTWYRSEVRGIERIPSGGALIVSNHSGGLITVDIPVLAVDFFEHFGYDRQLYTLSHDVLFSGPLRDIMPRAGIIRADRDNAERALRSGATIMVFPGGDYDVARPTTSANVIDFNGRTGYVKTAIEAGVPIVPAVSIGGQENQIYLTRGKWLAKRLGLRRIMRSDYMPISVGVPFGISLLNFPINLPLPTKIVAEVLEPIDIAKKFGDNPDLSEVDDYVRSVMQSALNRLARERDLPVIG
jgi:1-acyl-sn-glycerol-3-phosphate acyltransferase